MRVYIVAFLVVLVGMVAPGAQASGADGLDMKNVHVLEGIMTGGQPTKADLRKLKADGYTTVINLRTGNEILPTVNKAEADKMNFPEGDYAASIGLHYVSIPVKIPEGINEANARLVDAALKAADGPVLLHCSSGGRAGAMLALRAFYLEGKTPEEALAIGRKAGVSILEPDVKMVLGVAGR